MAKKFILSAMFGFCVWASAQACDACGCSILGNGIGMLTAYRSNLVGLNYQYASFQSHPEHGNSTDYFHTVELSARYYLSDRIKILFAQPYRINVRNSQGDNKSLKGISDTRIMAGYSLLPNMPIGKQTTLFWEANGGLKIPSGKYDPHIHNTDLPENFNIGNGSWGFLVQSNLVLKHQTMGLMLGGAYTHHSKSSSDYQFGHQWTGQATLFWEMVVTKNLRLIPNASISSEWIGEDAYATGNTVSGTGGKGTFLAAGLNFNAKNWLLGLSYATPLSQNYSHGEVEAQERISCQITYVF